MTHDFPYDNAVDPSEADMDSKGLNKVRDLFLRQQQKGLFPGGQIVVRRHGKKVLNIAFGLARGWQGRGGDPVEVKQNTAFAVFSSGKPMAAVIIALLESRGQINLYTPLAEFLPELGSYGRESITLLDVLTHRGGIILPSLIHTPEINGDAEALWRRLVETPPRYPRGTLAYMPLEYGIIIDRLVKNISGKNCATLLEDELARPLKLPNLQYGLGSHQINDIAWNYWLGKDRCVVAEMNIADNFEDKFNNEAVFSAKNPAFGMSADAANLAAFYEFLLNNGRTRDGNQLLPDQMIKSYTSKQTSGWDKSVKAFLSLGRGFLLGTLTPSLYDWWGSSGCFGHAGIFSSIAYGDHKTGLSVAIVTNGNKSIGDFFKRTIALNHTLRKACNS